MKYEVFLDRPWQDCSMIVEAPSKEKALEIANKSHSGNETTIDCVRTPLPTPLQKPHIYTYKFVLWEPVSEYIFKKYNYSEKEQRDVCNEWMYLKETGYSVILSNCRIDAYPDFMQIFKYQCIKEFGCYDSEKNDTSIIIKF